MNLQELFTGSALTNLRAECNQWKRVCDRRTEELNRTIERAEKAEARHMKMAIEYDAQVKKLRRLEVKSNLLEADMKSIREITGEHCTNE